MSSKTMLKLLHDNLLAYRTSHHSGDMHALPGVRG